MLVWVREYKLTNTSTLSVDAQQACLAWFSFQLCTYIGLGSLQTPATWIRDFVRSHPSYKFDSVVNQEINYDLLVAVDEM